MVVGAVIAAGYLAYNAYQGYRSYQRASDYRKMQRDYERNTGRKIRYDKVRGYAYNAYDSYANAARSATSVGSQVYGTYKANTGTTRDASEL